MPASSFGRLGLDCRACTQGPCGISPFEGSQGTVCGRDRDDLVAVNFLRLIADGAAAHVTASADANGPRKANSYHRDLAVVRQALRGQPGYIGMIGSQRKRETVFEALVRDGCGSDDLSRVVCPIGLPIEAETPEEIAISIVAQLIATRAARFPKS